MKDLNMPWKYVQRADNIDLCAGMTWPSSIRLMSQNSLPVCSKNTAISLSNVVPVKRKEYSKDFFSNWDKLTIVFLKIIFQYDFAGIQAPAHDFHN